MAKIKKALLSVSDKTGIVEFARELETYNIQFISTGGTARILRSNGLEIMDVADYTGYPEMMDGRVKTLHPKIHGGLLGIRSNPEHLHDMNEYNIEGIDMIVVNVKPVEEEMFSRGLALEDAMNRIDIGGIALLRSAAKNFKSVTAVTDSGDYDAVISEMRNNNGAVSPEMNLQLAIKVFETTSRYDHLISDYLRQKALVGFSEKKYIEIPR
ncbi:MAG TPA: IMP cyclohydrolase [Spirochaetota bacterium]|nr:IMP cyclohydrolase [Spirochaetota bacterium]HPC39835.1 IMP cyclohydrolase [Spirochaetota bacterium]HPL18557.1 IMP cyclohydrolase [Spirochaetota bacterium]HRS77066.1 IMP cyclohydrolase [Spirochaetota bacterium]HRT74852.1 IMP cyclohydrolase [Spirochaetota bacterium]